MKTYQPKASEVKRSWHLIDADGVILGRMATEVARLLTGKNKPSFSRHMDMGDYVVVVNAEKVKLSGKKTKQKVYRSHSGYPGGFKEVTFAQMKKEHPERIVGHAVAGMLPDNRLKKDRMARLKVVVGGENPFKDKF
ncbi:MAG: 50S ribosomal protein L13 [Candidatus Woesebacteria bacterium GW2011_GWD1_47_21]|nr:MAG: 50S ribosomal protein L13 [Candidatus Woesebacteria bacterium GW2011_GWD1_47_21]OGM83188.1 MAG: 50S ribosomal protein L13 [Candidatus Woesebacteria bacterium RIFOXYB1_FULL_47_31]OGM86733.1 MAG: 50S ribosomal protein L13 [Candidatus Woesebacteria bacterium RIFOXYC1_FULL_46_16]OGM89048.1 MAG: 50S ribosomal protein L13 [Candidatus Woesebacteria bacterium RIFOXYD1_FULL_46_19]